MHCAKNPKACTNYCPAQPDCHYNLANVPSPWRRARWDDVMSDSFAQPQSAMVISSSS